MTPTVRSAIRLCLVLACGASGAAACRRSGRLEAPAGILLISPTVLEFSAFARQNLIGTSITQSKEVRSAIGRRNNLGGRSLA